MRTHVRGGASMHGLLWIAACAPPAEVSGPAAGSDGIDPTGHIVAEDGSSTGTSGPAEDTTGAPSCGGWDCGSLECVADRCHGCEASADCLSGTICYGDDCVPPEDAPACASVPHPVCGDGVIGALEECDGSDACDGCDDGVEPEVWWSFDEPYFDRAVEPPT